MTSARRLRRRLLDDLYPGEGAEVATRIEAMLADRPPRPASEPWDERSAWLIAYPDQFVRPGEASLATLARVLETHLSPTITGVHVLPFHPSSSDGGFSITAHDAVDPAHGTWSDVRTLAQSTMLMADAVMNHASAQGDWFTRFLAGEEPYRSFFRTVVDENAGTLEERRPGRRAATAEDGVGAR